MNKILLTIVLSSLLFTKYSARILPLNKSRRILEYANDDIWENLREILDLGNNSKTQRVFDA